MKTELIVSTTIEGLHYWPNAPKEFADFGSLHRHLFRFIIYVPVSSEGGTARRPAELWRLRRQLRAWVETLGVLMPDNFYNFEGCSCEGLAERLLEISGASKVFVGEDDNFGAEVSKDVSS